MAGRVSARGRWPCWQPCPPAGTLGDSGRTMTDPALDAEGPAAAADTGVRGRLHGASARAAAAGRWAERHAEDLRARSALVAGAFEAEHVHRRRAGSVLAGGIAFRVFLWVLPAALFASGLAGLLQLSGSASPEQVARKLGLGASVARTVRQTTLHSDQSSIWLIVLGLAGTVYAAMGLIR